MKKPPGRRVFQCGNGLMLLATDGGDGLFQGFRDVLARSLCCDVGGCGHVGFFAQPLSELFGIGDHESVLSFGWHSAFGPALRGRRADAQAFADGFPGLYCLGNLFAFAALTRLAHGYSVMLLRGVDDDAGELQVRAAP